MRVALLALFVIAATPASLLAQTSTTPPATTDAAPAATTDTNPATTDTTTTTTTTTPAAAPTTTAEGHYSSTTTPLGVMLDDPAAKAVIDSLIPGLSTNPQVGMALGMTLKSLQPYAKGKMTDELLAKVDEALAQLPPAK